jgi:hypothetical protein
MVSGMSPGDASQRGRGEHGEALHLHCLRVAHAAGDGGAALVARVEQAAKILVVAAVLAAEDGVDFVEEDRDRSVVDHAEQRGGGGGERRLRRPCQELSHFEYARLA